MIDKIKTLQLQNKRSAPIGFSGDTVYIIDKGYQGRDVVVKISKRKEVLYEGENLIWLRRYTKVPQVYELGEIDGHWYCIMEKLPGVMLQQLFGRKETILIIEMYAQALKRFHQIPIEGLPYNHTLEQKVNDAHKVVQNKEAKTQYFEREFSKMTAEEVYALMQSYRYEQEDIVLCHGDVCMPNVIVDDEEVGFIDIVQIGAVDRHLDIAIALRTLRYNLELHGDTLTKEYIDVFKKAYGIEKLDMHKIMFHILLDELTNG